MKYFFYILISILLISSCSKTENGVQPSDSGTGKGGSLARFAISENSLFVLSQDSLKTFSLTDAKNPELLDERYVGNGIETMFPKDSLLFLGAQTGLYIYDISIPSSPIPISTYFHITSCDPVVANDQYAFVTLRTETTCNRGINELQIVDLSNINNPYLVKSYPMTNPIGLGIENNQLFICDRGLKVYDATNVNNLILKHHFKIEAFDVIPNNDILMVIGKNGLYQYRLQADTIVQLSHLKMKLG